MMGANITYFVAEALAHDPNNYKALDCLYQRNKLLFYKTAEASEYYDCFMIKQNSVIKMEYIRKALGVMLYVLNHMKPQDDCQDDCQGDCPGQPPCDYRDDFFDFIMKAYPYVCQYLRNCGTVSFDDFMLRFVKKKKGIDNVSDDELNGTLVILLFMSKYYQKEIDMDFTYQTLMNDYIVSRMEVCGGESNAILTGDAFSRVAASFIKRHCKGYSVNDFNSGRFLREMEEGLLSQYLVLFDFIPLDPASIIESTNYDGDILKNLVKGFISHKGLDIDNNFENVDKSELHSYLMHGFLVYKLAQAYGEVRDYYFKNNKETLLLEIENVKKDIKEIELKCKSLTGAKKETEARLIEAERVNKRLRKEIEVLKRNQTDLAGLRQLAFSLKSDEIVEPNEPIRFDSLKDIKAVIAGGQDNWQAKLKEHLPGCIFIGINSEKFDVRLLHGCRDIFLNTRHMTHKLYYRVIENLDRDARLHYFSRDNIHLCLIDIANSKSYIV